MILSHYYLSFLFMNFLLQQFFPIKIYLLIKKGKPRRSGVSFGHNRRNYARNQQTFIIILNFPLSPLIVIPIQVTLLMRIALSKKYNQRILSAYNLAEVYAAAAWLL